MTAVDKLAGGNGRDWTDGNEHHQRRRRYSDRHIEQKMWWPNGQWLIICPRIGSRGNNKICMAIGNRYSYTSPCSRGNSCVVRSTAVNTPHTSLPLLCTHCIKTLAKCVSLRSTTDGQNTQNCSLQFERSAHCNSFIDLRDGDLLTKITIVTLAIYERKKSRDD